MDEPDKTSNGQRLRHDGWTRTRRRELPERVAAGESIVAATRALNKSTTSLYQLRGRDPEFARELHFALEVSHDSFEAEARERGLGNFEEVETADGSERRTRRWGPTGAYVLADASVRSREPNGWAAAVVQAYHAFEADRVVAEANNGGDMVEGVLKAVDAGLPIKLVRASRGKSTRAEPVAALYAAGKASHAGAFPELEDEMCAMIVGGGYEGSGRSPDRADALVWTLTEPMLGKPRTMPRAWVG